MNGSHIQCLKGDCFFYELCVKVSLLAIIRDNFWYEDNIKALMTNHYLWE